jgi:5-methyltetrahydropteroyltriglutamate--homocysteine methyltransferase
MPYFRRMKLQQFVSEYATPRAGSLEVLTELPQHAQMRFGAVNPRTSELEPADDIVARVKRLADLTEAERIFLNPDCGFGTFAERPVGTPELAFKKLCALSRAAAILRQNALGTRPSTA